MNACFFHRWAETRLPNGIFANTRGTLPHRGFCQRPDFAWWIHHHYQAPAWSVSPIAKVWCEVVGEGKPTPVPQTGTNDHALNQVMMAASACIYYQISLGKQDPSVLTFTLNEEKVRFFSVSGTVEWCPDGTNSWRINYRHISDRDLDLSILGDGIKFHTLSKVLRERNDESIQELNNLWTAAQGRERVRWWISEDDPLNSTESIPEASEGGGGEARGVEDAEFENGGEDTGRYHGVDSSGSYPGLGTVQGGGSGNREEEDCGAGGAGGGGAGAGGSGGSRWRWVINRKSSGPGGPSRQDTSRRRGVGWFSLGFSSPFRKLGVSN
jgi:uncharacterized membrane protein YgcG